MSRPLVNEIAAFIEAKASGVADVAITEVDFGTIAGTADSVVKNISVQFPTSGFDEDDVANGAFAFRMWGENFPVLTGVNFNYELGAALLTDPLSSPTLLPTVTQLASNIAKATYFDATDKELRFIGLQIESSATPEAYDTEKKGRANPVIMLEWLRQTEGLLDTLYPDSNDLHSFAYSQVDVYTNVVKDGITRKFMIGWCADEDLEMEFTQNIVDFKKGKPTATVATFMQECLSSIKGQIATKDVYFLQKGRHRPVSTQGDYLVQTETNKQGIIESDTYFFEYNLSSGNRVIFEIPRGQVSFTGSETPGSSDISKVAFEIKALADPSTNRVSEWKVTAAMSQRAALKVKFDIDVA